MPFAILLLIAVNLLAFALLVIAEGDVSISAETAAAFGALLPLQYMRGEYWRFISSGFLHFSLLHIVTNGICLLAWGAPIERYFGPIRLVVLFLGAILAGALTSVWLHDELFVSAGASGGVSGLLGALLMLQLLGRIGLAPSFFAINIGLNIAVALLAPGIDWQAHLGGFVGGLLFTPLLMPLRAAL